MSEKTTEDKILAAARRVFQHKGMAGSRMQEIADEAGINKALLHYYFRSKEKLFMAVLGEAFSMLIPRFNTIIRSDLGLFEKIKALCSGYIDFLTEHPYLPAFIIYEMNANPERFIVELQERGGFPDPASFVSQIQDAVAGGTIRAVTSQELIINIIALSVFPFAAAPMIRTVMKMNEAEYRSVMQARKESIATFIINAIKR